MANRVLAAVRKFLNWCVSRGLLELSPCSGISASAREIARHRVLTDDELAAVLKAARAIGYPFGCIVEFLALTAQRREEVGRMRWDQVDVKRRLDDPRARREERQASCGSSERPSAR